MRATGLLLLPTACAVTAGSPDGEAPPAVDAAAPYAAAPDAVVLDGSELELRSDAGEVDVGVVPPLVIDSPLHLPPIDACRGVQVQLHQRGADAPRWHIVDGMPRYAGASITEDGLLTLAPTGRGGDEELAVPVAVSDGARTSATITMWARSSGLAPYRGDDGHVLLARRLPRALPGRAYAAQLFPDPAQHPCSFAYARTPRSATVFEVAPSGRVTATSTAVARLGGGPHVLAVELHLGEEVVEVDDVTIDVGPSECTSAVVLTSTTPALSWAPGDTHTPCFECPAPSPGPISIDTWQATFEVRSPIHFTTWYGHGIRPEWLHAGLASDCGAAATCTFELGYPEIASVLLAPGVHSFTRCTTMPVHFAFDAPRPPTSGAATG